VRQVAGESIHVCMYVSDVKADDDFACRLHIL
jgi:hypothetical protein